MKLFYSFLLFFLLIANGCIPVLIGTGVVAGYTLSNDTASGEIKTEYRVLWDVVLDKMQSMNAEIINTNESKGIVKAKLADHDLTIKIDTINSQLQKLTISARKYMLPKPQFAQKIFLQIVKELE
ncbi:MAG: DUF3568 family protein [Candidatus Omnitrophota bacterium]